MPAPKRPNTAAATRAAAVKARRTRQQAMAAELSAAGWFVATPEQAGPVAALLALVLSDPEFFGDASDEQELVAARDAVERFRAAAG